MFRPAGLTASGVDNDAHTHAAHMAKGYEPEGTYALKPATEIHWSAKTGNASVYTTAANEERWVETAVSRTCAEPNSHVRRCWILRMQIGYGWMRGENRRFGESVYYMNGRAPGFASFVLYLPHAQMTVVLFSNIYSSATTIGYDVAALAMGLPYEPLHFRDPAPTSAELKTCEGKFRFGADFYQSNAVTTLLAEDRELSMRLARRKHFATHPGFGRSFCGSIVLGGRQD